MKKTFKPLKTRTTGVTLAVIFGFFGWLYTYKFDAWKFWLNLCLCVITFGYFGIISWIWAIIDMSTMDKRIFEEYYG